MIWSLTHVEKADEQADQIRAETGSVLVRRGEGGTGGRTLIDRIEDDTAEIFQRHFRGCTRPAIVRHPERVTAADAEILRETIRCLRVRLKSIKLLQPITLDKQGNFWMAIGAAGRREIAQPDHRDRRESGEPRIDWETLVCYQPMKWDDFVAAETRRNLDGFPRLCRSGQFLQP